MSVPTYEFAARGEFLNRRADLARMEDWWSGRSRDALVLYGRRRVGKSWLFRRFAHGKPAILLVSERRAQGAQLKRFARDLSPHLGGVEPRLESVADLIATLYEIGRDEQVLAVIDELPYLLPSRGEARGAALTAVQAVMEERDSSRLKLVLCGSHIGQMAGLLGEGSPLRGRVTPLPVDALRFAEAQPFIAATASGERIERFAVSGGMSLYLDELARGGPLARRIQERVLDSRGPLFNDPREVLEDELREPGVYFSILEELGSGERSSGDIATALAKRTTDLSPYLRALREMGLVEQRAPLGARLGSRDQRFRLGDDFMRFWFRFVFPFQDDLSAGLRPVDHYAGEVAPMLADHVAPVFERLCREYARRAWGRRASRVGAWWGPALHELRRAGERTSEEIDVVGSGRGSVVLVGECKWTTRKLSPKVLDELETYKLPALRQSGLKVAAEPAILLFSRSGFKQTLIDVAATRVDVHLISTADLVDGLLDGENG
jgi:uncharacterized protein